MDSLEHERSSSSPSVKVSGLQREGTDGSVLRVHLEDGSLFLLEDHHPAATRLSVGEVLDEEAVELLESASDLFLCRRKALSLLARSEQCRSGLALKLLKKEHSRNSISQILDQLEDSGLLDDRRFAETWVRSRLRSRPEGPSRLCNALMSKGVNGHVAREAVDAVLEELGDDEAENTLRRAREKLARRSGMTDEKMITALVRLGFPFAQIKRVLSEVEAESADD
jgi:regulatory protein